MTEESKTPVAPAVQEPTSNDSSAPSKPLPEAIPYDRFKAVNDANKQLEQQLAEFKANQQKAEEEAAKQKGEFEKLYNDNLPKIQGFEDLSKTLAGLLESQKELIPEDKRKLIPSDYPPHKQLDWINANRELLVPSNSSKNLPVQPNGQTEGKTLHKASDIANVEYYTKHSADIQLAEQEGRIID